VLGIRPGATKAEVADAFRRYALGHHPDRGGDTATFQAGVDAYHRLTGAAPASSARADVVFHRRRRAGVPSLLAILGRRRPAARSLT
jgi:DnaJ family protein A protein 2